MSALSIIQQHCRIHGLNVPSTLVGSANTTTQQLYGILLQLLTEVVEESKFNVITREAVFQTTADADQGAMATLAPYGYQWAYPGTFFDRTLRRPLYGPLTEIEWQEIQAVPNPGPFYKFRIRGEHLLINPAPTLASPSTIAFEYVSSWAVVDASGSPKETVTEDTDTFVFPENILLRGVAYRWKQIKSLPYQSDETKYYELLNNYIARNKAPAVINVASPKQPDIRPGVFVPSGNWMQ